MIAFCWRFISISWSFFIFSSCLSSCFRFFSSMNSWCLASFSLLADSIFSRFSASLSILRKQILEWYSIGWHLKLQSRVQKIFIYLIASFWSLACSCSSFFLFSLSMASIWHKSFVKKKFNIYNSPVIDNLYLNVKMIFSTHLKALKQFILFFNLHIALIWAIWFSASVLRAQWTNSLPRFPAILPPDLVYFILHHLFSESNIFLFASLISLSAGSQKISNN